MNGNQKIVALKRFNAGDYKSYTISLEDKNRTKLNLANRRIVFTLKNDIDDADDKAVIKKVYDITGDEVLSFQIELTTQETIDLYGTFEYDIRVSFIGVPNEIQFTPLRGQLTIDKPVTRIMGE